MREEKKHNFLVFLVFNFIVYHLFRRKKVEGGNK